MPGYEGKSDVRSDAMTCAALTEECQRAIGRLISLMHGCNAGPAAGDRFELLLQTTDREGEWFVRAVLMQGAVDGIPRTTDGTS